MLGFGPSWRGMTTPGPVPRPGHPGVQPQPHGRATKVVRAWPADRTDSAVGLTPQVRNAVLALIVGGIATISLPLALGQILGPMVGGVMLNWLSRRWLFLVKVPVITLGLALAWRLLPSDRPGPATAPARLDVTGLVLLGRGYWARCS